MAIDLVDDCTFWYTSQYIAVGGTTPWSSRIASFRFPSCLSPDFALSVSPSSQIAVPGQSTNYTIRVMSSGGFSADITLSVSGLPDGCVGTFTPNPSTGTSVLTISTAGTTQPGSYTLTISGVSGSVSRTTSVSADVMAVSSNPAEQFVFGVISGDPLPQPQVLLLSVGDSPPVVVPGTGGDWLKLTVSGSTTATLALNSSAVATLGSGIFVCYVAVGAGLSVRALPVTLAVDSLAISRILDSAGYRPQAIAPGALFTAFGANEAMQALRAKEPLGVKLGGTSLTITDSSGIARSALLLYISPSQINFIAPEGIAPGPGTLTVANTLGYQATASVPLSSVSPGLFSADQTGQGVAAAVVLRVAADGTRTTSLAASCDPNTGKCVATPIDLNKSTDQVFVSFYGTGIRGRSSLEAAAVSIGNTPVKVLYAGAQPQYPGVDQIDICLPPSLAGLGQLAVTISVDGHTANSVLITGR